VISAGSGSYSTTASRGRTPRRGAGIVRDDREQRLAVTYSTMASVGKDRVIADMTGLDIVRCLERRLP
jgi:hypothetical protein